MAFSLFVTDDQTSQWHAPFLFATSEATELPPHPEGKAWRWAMTSSEEPRKVLIGRMLVSILKRRGWVISTLPLDQVLRLRPAAPNLAPLPAP